MEFYKTHNNKILFCCVDNSDSYLSDHTRTLIRNQSDYTISNIYQKGYSVLKGSDADQLLAASDGYDYAVVFNIGTEFINGLDFFHAVEELVKQNFYIAGHVLDRKEAWYELHHQCFVVNLNLHRRLGRTLIGKQMLNEQHEELFINRSQDNYHDDYTPKWVSAGNIISTYTHKCHGWQILREAFFNDLTVLVFDEKLRHSKRHYYPENQVDFEKHILWAYHRKDYCAEEFIHVANTETSNFIPSRPFRQVITTASGIWYDQYIDKINPVKVIFYDYNLKSLEYWKKHVPIHNNVNYEFLHCDLLLGQDFLTAIDPSLGEDTLVNLSNVFNYEATTFFYSKEQRSKLEFAILDKLKKLIPDAWINFSSRVEIDLPLYGRLNDALVLVNHF